MIAMGSGPRPELGELKPGQLVMVYRSSNDMRHRKPEDRVIPARVVKVARVWIELESDDSRGAVGFRQTWRMRRDTQDEGTQYPGSNAQFTTLEQYRWDEAQRWARELLREQGIELRHGSQWLGREADLADHIVNGMNKEASA